MPYKDQADKREWNRRDRAGRPADYKRWRNESHTRALAGRPKCACGCGQTPRSAYRSRYCLGHQPPSSLGRVASASATIRIRLRDLAWAAGFLEGEGSFSGRSRVSASQVQREPLDRLASLFGGTVRERKDRTSRPWHQQQLHQWDVSGARARGVMLTLYPMMSQRRQQQIHQVFMGPS